jgi:DNA-directed RNA polymerase subunit RPC12/RpoP
MKVRCTQCGASLRVLDTDFYLRCPYCEANVVVRNTEKMPSVVNPVLDTDSVMRLFPSGIVESVTIRYFPYAFREGSLTPVFSQVFDELLTYMPPGGDRQLWDEEDLEPESVIPFSPELAGEEDTVVYHPFYLVMQKGSGYSSGVLVDGVSGRVLGPEAGEETGHPRRSREVALRALAVGIVPSALVFILASSGETGIFGGALFSTVAAGLAVILVKLLGRKEPGHE